MREKAEESKIMRKVRDFFYGISVRMHGFKNKIFKKKKKPDANRNDLRRNRFIELGFLTSLFLWPTITIILNYIFVNANTWMLAFQEYDMVNNEFVFIGGFDNFVKAYEQIVNDANQVYGVTLGQIFTNSLINYFFGFIVTTPLQLAASFAIYKKIKFNRTFVVIMYLPQIIASMVFTITYKYMLAKAFPILFGVSDFLQGRETAFSALLMYGVWTQLGGALMIVTGTFARIPQDCIEAAEIDGCSLWKEFWYITFPNYYPVFSISIFTGVAGIFTGMPSTYNFYGNDAPSYLWTFGYYFFNIAVGRDLSTNMANYPIASASGLIFTIIVTPIVLITKWLVEKGDKSEAM